jgi:hypothetical protein
VQSAHSAHANSKAKVNSKRTKPSKHKPVKANKKPVNKDRGARPKAFSQKTKNKIKKLQRQK